MIPARLFSNGMSSNFDGCKSDTIKDIRKVGGTHPLDYLQISFPKGCDFYYLLNYHVFDRCHVQNSAVSILTDWESAQKGYSYFSLNAKTYSRKLSSDKELKALSLPRVRNWKSFRFENVITLVYRKMSIFWARVKGGGKPHHAPPPTSFTKHYNT